MAYRGGLLPPLPDPGSPGAPGPQVCVGPGHRGGDLPHRPPARRRSSAHGPDLIYCPPGHVGWLQRGSGPGLHLLLLCPLSLPAGERQTIGTVARVMAPGADPDRVVQPARRFARRPGADFVGRRGGSPVPPSILALSRVVRAGRTGHVDQPLWLTILELPGPGGDDATSGNH